MSFDQLTAARAAEPKPTPAPAPVATRGTFYLAGSSEDVPRVRAAARVLERRGYRWHAGFDWTVFDQAGTPKADWPGLARMDIACAVDADLFVMLLPPFAKPAPLGACVEFGARLFRSEHDASKRAHVVLFSGQGEHFFHYHPAVLAHRDWQTFVAYLDAQGEP